MRILISLAICFFAISSSGQDDGKFSNPVVADLLLGNFDPADYRASSNH